LRRPKAAPDLEWILVLKPATGSYVSAVTVLEVIQRSTDFLTKKCVEAPRLQAELLLAHVLKLQRMQLYLNFERTLSSSEQDSIRQLIKRRGEREPLQHIIGSTSFCGLEIAVNRHVLIPRPETELLAEQGWLFLKGRPGKPSALDFGTGSGCLAIALATKCPAATIVALDVSADALHIAQSNAVRYQAAERINFVLGNGLAAVPQGAVFDLVVANPPYIPSSEIQSLEPEVRDYDPRAALDGGPDGLECYRHLSSRAGDCLQAGGKIMMEFGDGQDESIANLFQRENWIVEQIIRDYTQRPRIMIAHRTV
jgi:release factor glutamine methyltransferase